KILFFRRKCAVAARRIAQRFGWFEAKPPARRVSRNAEGDRPCCMVVQPRDEEIKRSSRRRKLSQGQRLEPLSAVEKREQSGARRDNDELFRCAGVNRNQRRNDGSFPRNGGHTASRYADPRRPVGLQGIQKEQLQHLTARFDLLNVPARQA